jgi:threonyl-tRNA synthetase
LIKDNGITGLQIAESISPRLAEEALAVEVNGTVKDLNASINSDCSKLKF